jgi:hypothetical protein
MVDPIVSTGARAGEYDAMVTAKADEPVLTLQGGDPFAAPTVLYWVSLARAAGMASDKPEDAEKLLRKASSAELVAWAMISYFKGEQSEQDAVHVEEVDKTELTIALVQTVRRIHNAVGEIVEAADALAKLREFPEVEVALRQMVEPLKCQADTIEPRQLMRRDASRG